MSRRAGDAQVFRDVQGARVARWLRDGEAGNLFLGSDGEFYHILECEAEAFERHLRDWIDRGARKQFSAGHGKALERIAWTLFIGCFPAAAYSHLLALACFLFSIAFGIAAAIGATASDARYERGLREWRARQTAWLKANGRAGVAAEVAQRSRRHNLFRWIMLAHIPLVIGIYLAMGLSPGTDRNALVFTGLIVGLLITMALFDWAARRVDATHRRRKWLS